MKMQRFFLFVSLLLAGFSSFAQPYQPVGVENAHWFMYATPDGVVLDNHAFVVRGDTLINSMTYKKLYYQDFAPEPAYLLEEEYLWGVVRDDSLERKVYVIAFEPYIYGYQCPMGEEQLLFDFSILPGDTTAHCLWYENHPWILDSTYISYKYGADRRTIYSEEYWWIFGEIYEGIGSREGLLGTLSYGEQPSEDYYWLIKYCIGSDEDCGIISGTADVTFAERPALIFPNPVIDELNLQFFRPVHGAIRIYDAMGRLHWSGASSGEPDQQIGLGNWPPGLYLLQLEEEGRRYTVKFVKM
jgi:hypothetical protein